MKKYFIDETITFCFPRETSKTTCDYGVLSEYIGKEFTRLQMDKIICKMIMNHPYIDNSMTLKVRVMWREGNMIGFYHILEFSNDKYEKQKKSTLKIKYEKIKE
jgi:hypothetical protein